MTLTPEERQELRNWAARLMGWMIEPHCPDMWVIKHGPHDIQCKSHIKDYRPDSPDAPAWQILGVVERMRELGWSLEVYVGEGRAIDVTLRSIRVPGPIQRFNKTYYDNSLFEAILLAAKATGVVG